MDTLPDLPVDHLAEVAARGEDPLERGRELGFHPTWLQIITGSDAFRERVARLKGENYALA